MHIVCLMSHATWYVSCIMRYEARIMHSVAHGTILAFRDSWYVPCIRGNAGILLASGMLIAECFVLRDSWHVYCMSPASLVPEREKKQVEKNLSNVCSLLESPTDGVYEKK